MIVDINSLVTIMAGGVTAFGGVYATVRHLAAASRLKKEMYREAILREAREEMAKIEKDLNEKIKALHSELEDQKLSMDKDLEHMRAIYGAEIKSLGEKIENLREDLSQNHASMVALLTRLVNN